MSLKNKKILVYGLGKSGIGAIKLLKLIKAKIFFYDDNTENLKNLEDNSIIKVEAITENFLDGIDLIVVNPSVSIYSENLKLAFIKNVKIILSRISLTLNALRSVSNIRSPLLFHQLPESFQLHLR